MGRIGGLERERTRLIRRVPYAGVIERTRIGIRIGDIDRERERLLWEMRRIRTMDLPYVETEIAKERLEISKKKPPPPIKEELIGDESVTGYDIYYDFEYKIYRVREPETRRLIREETKICMEFTASLRTGRGHDTPVLVEITCTCYVEEMGLSALIEAERRVEKNLKDWLVSQGWENLIGTFEKEAVSYNGETLVKLKHLYPWIIPDFPEVYVSVEKKKPRSREYSGKFRVEEEV